MRYAAVSGSVRAGAYRSTALQRKLANGSGEKSQRSREAMEAEVPGNRRDEDPAYRRPRGKIPKTLFDHLDMRDGVLRPVRNGDGGVDGVAVSGIPDAVKALQHEQQTDCRSPVHRYVPAEPGWARPGVDRRV